ncbi:hypothetical protein ACFE04_013877 [Oxalis oulophora]
MGQFQLHFCQLAELKTHSIKFPPMPSISNSQSIPLLSHSQCPAGLSRSLAPPLFLRSSYAFRAPFMCKVNGGSGSGGSDVTAQLDKPERRRKPEKRVDGIFWILLLNFGIYVADHLFQIGAIQNLYLYHNRPTWYQFVTATFCHASWGHLSSNMFFLYIFGKFVEEEEGNFALWLSYVFTGAGANIISWLVLSRNAVSVGASGAVFGLFAISVLLKMSWDWKKILEVLILGQFVIGRVTETVQTSTALPLPGRGNAMQNVNYSAHLSGALIGALLVWFIGKVSAKSPDEDVTKLIKKKSNNNP